MIGVLVDGGFGTRLRPLTFTDTKSLLPIAGTPNVHRILETYKASGIKKVIININTGYQERFNSELAGKNIGMELDYELEEALSETRKPGTTRSTYELFKRHNFSEPVVLIAGDNYFSKNVDLKALEKFTQETDSIASIVGSTMEKKELTSLGVISLRKGSHLIEKLEEKPKEPKSNIAATGVLYYTPKIVEYLGTYVEEELEAGKKPDRIGDFHAWLVNKGENVGCYMHDFNFVDFGKPEEYLKVNHIAFDQELGGQTRIDESVKRHANAHFIPPVIVERGCKIGKDAVIGPKTHLMENVTACKDAKVSGSVIFENSIISEDCYVSDSVLAAESKTREGTSYRKIFGSVKVF